MSRWYVARREVVGEMSEESRPGKWLDSVAERVFKESMMSSFPARRWSGNLSRVFVKCTHVA